MVTNYNLSELVNSIVLFKDQYHASHNSGDKYAVNKYAIWYGWD